MDNFCKVVLLCLVKRLPGSFNFIYCKKYLFLFPVPKSVSLNLHAFVIY